MIEIFISPKNGESKHFILHEKIENGVWINLTSPDSHEIEEISLKTAIPPEFLKAPLDEEERPRIEFEDKNSLIIIDIPKKADEEGILLYETIPLGIAINEKYIVTVCLKDNIIIDDFRKGKITNCFTYKRTRFLLQILFRTSSYFLRYLRVIDRTTEEVEDNLQKSLQNKELFELLNLEKSRVYFSTSLKANEIVLEKIMRFRQIQMYEEDAELLEDVIIENKQAIEMANIYSNILSGMMDAFASIINNNMNRIMKFLASITIIIAVPTMIASFLGMNVPLPFQNNPAVTLIIFLVSISISVLLGVAMYKREFM